MPYRCLIVDDERPALKLLTAYIAKLPSLELVASCESGLEAMAALQQQPIDLLFLDIQMPDFTGLELLRSMQVKPEVILTTAYRDYAVEGFALQVADYLVKPFSLERFVQAVNKATGQIQLKQSTPSSAVALSSNATPSPTEDAFFVRTNYKMEKVVFADILYVESMREYVAIHTAAKRYVVHQTMSKLEQELPAPPFTRIHRSHLVNTQYITAVNGNQVVVNDKNFPIGASYREAFFRQLRTL